jgi:eukaryotic translation initiation factor 2C
MTLDLLNAYWQKSKETHLPTHILFYRDGVSESQYGMVLDEELPQISAALAEMKVKFNRKFPKIKYTPKVTLLVVGKRHHARFFRDATSPANIKAGLIVDHTVTTPDRYSFYLQSHDSPIGTTRSGHYVVIENESTYTTDQIQAIVSPHTLSNCFTPPVIY